ncbi:MAG TPA: M1 family aminopeptidase [Candidatus Acidoferrales bacterium]|nr:M1 family aminopeptidase [Candidatus Acidoferrales bacterium]
MKPKAAKQHSSHAIRMILCYGFIFAVTLTAPARMATPDAHVFGDPTVWQSAPSRTYHVENYKLGIRFNEDKGEVFGDEVVTLEPFRPHFEKFFLNSAELTIDAVSLEPSKVKLKFSTEDSRLWITLDRQYDAKERLRVRILYHGLPRTGLFFINPTTDYPKWPREVYSQGEPEFNHYWFPCWDYPNDMSTSETVTTVPEGQSVVSNGRLVQVTHAAGAVTYDWVESIPHSSYLISIAIGPWRKVTDHYKGIPVDYYVPRSASEAQARRSFHLTPDMIGFFSRATGLVYPYEQYAQTAVHNFIFGGQENVSATTLTDWTLHDERADQDYPSTGLVSHELGQHWFGDYVQSGDWADIWLNEGFATYLSALYTQYHEGTDAYRFEIYQDQVAAQMQDRNDYLRPIVDGHFTDPLQMFDAITHEKGAAVLDMLRYIIDGDIAASHPASQEELLFQSLHRYLAAHREQTADTADLIAAIRETTGLELGWFFREWVSMAGQPDYRVQSKYDSLNKIERLTVTQIQQAAGVPHIFEMPIEVGLYGPHGQQKKIQVRDDSRQQEFDVPLDFAPEWVDFDPDDFIEKTVQFEQPIASWIAEAQKDPSMMSRLLAVQQLGGAAQADREASAEALMRVLENDEFYGVRAAAATSLGKLGGSLAKRPLLLALQQPDSRVRAAAIRALGPYAQQAEVYDALVKELRADPSDACEGAAAGVLGQSGKTDAVRVLREALATGLDIHVRQSVLGGLAETKNSQVTEILLAQAQPGVPEQVRLAALSALAEMGAEVKQAHKLELDKVVRASLHDPFLLVRQAGEKLVGAFGLTEFRTLIQENAQRAPMAFQRDAARRILSQLQRTSTEPER